MGNVAVVFAFARTCLLDGVENTEYENRSIGHASLAHLE